MKLLLPLAMAAVGVGGGIGAGVVLKGDAPEAEITCPTPDDTPTLHAPAPQTSPEALEGREFVKLSNQFVVPVIQDERVGSLLVVSIALEMATGQTELVYAREPKLRDLFLQVLFDHASVGRFSGAFTTSRNLDPLRDELRIVAKRILGAAVSDVLITEIARQDA